MVKSIPVKRKKRGRPATGVDPLVGVRMPPEERKAVEAWIAEQTDELSLSKAIRRLIQVGLASEAAGKPAPAPAEPVSAPVKAGKSVVRKRKPSEAAASARALKAKPVKAAKKRR
jgi:hypothetical protein